MDILQWDPGSFSFVFAIVAVAVVFNLYWFVSHSGRVRAHLVKRYGEEDTLEKYILYQKGCGIFFLAIVPAVVAWLWLGKTPAYYGFSYPYTTLSESVYWVLGLSAIIWPLNYFNAKRAESLRMYPQIRKKVWTRRTFFLNALGWCLYLFSYEFLFRGILLTESVEAVGVWGAIAINIGFYSVSHLPKGATETWGAFPMGIVLCFLALKTGNIWAGCIVHFFLSWSAEIFTFIRNPEMRMAKR